MRKIFEIIVLCLLIFGCIPNKNLSSEVENKIKQEKKSSGKVPIKITGSDSFSIKVK